MLVKTWESGHEIGSRRLSQTRFNRPIERGRGNLCDTFLAVSRQQNNPLACGPLFCDTLDLQNTTIQGKTAREKVDSRGSSGAQCVNQAAPKQNSLSVQFKARK
jgi:hypothetical protein